jgi:hypothetical protein
MTKTEPGMVVAQMNTNDYIWQGAGTTQQEAQDALLIAWAQHRDMVVSRNPALAGSLPLAADMPRHFAIHFRTYAAGAGYRDGERLV